jgi:hypothetical protein
VEKLLFIILISRIELGRMESNDFFSSNAAVDYNTYIMISSRVEKTSLELDSLTGIRAKKLASI